MKDLHATWPHRWIAPKAKAKGSKIHGLGIISIKPISKGETIAVLGGVIISQSEINKYREKMGHQGIQIDEEFFICPTSREELEQTGVFNHSCDPNCGFESVIKLIAIKDINEGEELLIDYAFMESNFEPFRCNCESPDCRKIIKPTDWKNTKIQMKLGKFFSPYLKKKFSEHVPK